MSATAAVQISIGAQLGNAFKNTFTTADKQLNKLGNSIKDLGSKMSQIQAYQQQKKAVSDASISYKQAQQKLATLNIELKKTQTPSRQLQNDIRKAQREVDKAKKTFQEAGIASHGMGKALKDSGIDTRNLAKEYDKLNKSIKSYQGAHNVLGKLQGAKQANLDKRANYRGQMFDTVALGATLYKSIKPAVDFEYAMARVGAITEEAADSEGFKKMSSMARELGRTTQYTASQTADAMQYLGMAGFNTNQIIAALPATLNLALIENMDMGRAADIASNILTGFGIKAEETTRVVDVLAEASRATNVSVETLGYTMKYVAPAAAAVGGSLEETAAIAGVLGDAGIQGTMSGTMLRAAYLRLAAPAKAGTAALEKMRIQLGMTKDELPDVAKEAIHTQAHLKKIGVKIFDKGKMRSMVDILKDMAKALKNATDEEKLSAVKAVFGDRAASGALAIFKNIETGRLDEVLTKTKNADGVAQEMADRMKNTTFGAYRSVVAAMEDIGIAFGSLLLPQMADGMRAFAKMANKVSELAEKYPAWSKGIGFAIMGLIGLKIGTLAVGYAFTFFAGGVINTAIGAFKFGRTLWMLLPVIKAVSLALFANPFGLIVLGITAAIAATVAIVKNWDWIKEKATFIWGAIADCFDRAWKRFKRSIQPIIDIKNKLGSMWDKLFGSDKEIKINTTEKISASNIKNIDPLTDKASSSISNSRNSSSADTYNITVNSPPGVSQQGLSEEVMRVIKEENRKKEMRRRSANYD